MYKLGAFMYGKLMAVFPNDFKYYEQIYEYATALAKESGAFIEVKFFDAEAYTEVMEAIKNA